jgi:tetratricopeptide (TPR) repeat protein
MLEQATDTSYRARLAWRLAIALGDAVEIEATRQKLDRALALGNRAMEYFEQGAEAGKQLATRDYLRGRLAYRLGAVFAVQKSEHERAIAWYDRAVPLLETPVPPFAVDGGKQGELFVSMAVSYWETNNRREALRLTNQGVKLMEEAAGHGLLAKPALAVPYSNLASMHEQLGDMQEARRYSELAARYEPKR